jgi:hypothetical protein
VTFAGNCQFVHRGEDDVATSENGESGTTVAHGRVKRLYGSILSRRPLPIRFERGTHWWQRAVHWWRYGSYHPDEDLLGVIDAAIDVLTTEMKAAEGILTGSRRESLDAIRDELNTELAEDVPELSVLLGIEAKINALYPPAVQRRRAWIIEERFRRVAPGQAADYWVSARGDSTLTEEHEDRIRRADEAVASATAAQLIAADALAAADQALADAKAAQGEGSAEATQAQSARDAAEAASGGADRALSSARLDRDLVHARCELERVQARLRGAERAARERPSDAALASGLIEAGREEVAQAQSRVDAAAAAVQVNAAANEAAGGDPAASPAGPESEEASDAVGGAAIDAEAQALLGYIHNAYLMGIARERAVRDLMRWLMMRFWSANIVLLIVLGVAWLLLELTTEGQYAPLIFGLLAIAAIGRVGATMSVVQRLQGAIANNVLSHDPIQELTRLRTGKNGINVALFSGGVFALLIYAFFASGIPALLGLDDGAAPAIGTIQDDAQAEAQQQVVSQNLARAARDLGDQEQRVRELEAALLEARGGGAGEGPDLIEDVPGSGPPAGEQPAPEPDADRIAEIEAQLAEANAVLEQRRSALAVTAAAAAPTAAEPVANQPQVEADPDPAGDEGVGDNAAGNDSAVNASAGNATSDNGQAGTDPGDNVQAADAKPEGEGQGQGQGAPLVAQSAPDAGDQCNAKEPCDPFVRLALALGLNEREDFFKLLIWAFLAGFAERLVPDALDAIANRAARRRRRLNGPGDETA